jgi:hypothetical protein
VDALSGRASEVRQAEENREDLSFQIGSARPA